MADKFIPSGEAAFVNKARNFATMIGPEPQRFGVSREDADALVSAVEEYTARRMEASNKYRCSRQLLDLRDRARDNVKRLMERLGRIIRINEQISGSAKALLGMTARPAKLTKSACPQTRPRLVYKGARHSKRVGRKVHLLRVEQPWAKMGDPICTVRTSKPAGARGVEIFVELLDEGEKIPSHPGELSGGRPWFLRSYTRFPVEAEFPFADRPMRVVYWARWVGMTGDVGPFSQTCVAEYEGPAFAHKALVDQTIARRRQQSVIITTARMELPEPIESIEALPGTAQRLLAEEAA